MGQKNKRLILGLKYTLLIFIMLMLNIVYVRAQQGDLPGVNEQIKIDDYDQQIKKINDEINKYQKKESKENIIEFDAQKIIKDVTRGSFKANPLSILNLAASYLLKEIYLNINILVKLIIIIILCSILKNLKVSFMNEGAGDMAFLACYVIMASILLLSFNTAITLGRDVLDNMVNFMYSTTPVMISLLVSSGNITSGSILQPLLIGVIDILATIIKNIYIPIIFLSTVLSIVNNISDRIQISRLAQILKQFAMWSFGLILTVFIAMISIQGTIGATIDGVTSKTAKFAVGSFIPVAGKYLADATDLVIGCTMLIKNAAGVAVMIGVIAICIVPLIKILAMIVLYKITCALVQPISDTRMVACINDVSGSMSFILGINAAVAVMFIISITSMIAAGNISQMMR